MEVEEVGITCAKKFKQYLETDEKPEKPFTHLNEILKQGNTNIDIIHGFLWKIFDDSSIENQILID